MALKRLLGLLSSNGQSDTSLDDTVDELTLLIRQAIPKLSNYVGQGKLILFRIDLGVHKPGIHGSLWLSQPKESGFYFKMFGKSGFSKIKWHYEDEFDNRLSAVYKIVDAKTGEIIYHNPSIKYDSEKAYRREEMTTQ